MSVCEKSSSIASKVVLILVNSTDLNIQDLWPNIQAFAGEKDIDNVLFTSDGYILFLSTHKRIRLNSGMRTIQIKLKLKHLPLHITSFISLPDGFFTHYFGSTYDHNKILKSFGSKFEPKAIETVLLEDKIKHKNRYKNELILSQSTYALVKAGELSVKEAGIILNNKKALQREKCFENLKPDLQGIYNATFEEWKPSDLNTTTFTQSYNYPPITVPIEGLPGCTHKKLKHYYIYSKTPGFGKTYVMEKFASIYNAHFINDTSNWISIPDNAQFIIFDEVSASNKLDLSNLKALTGGSASGFRGTCKTYGASYLPRTDAQIIMLSNQSIFDAFGRWHAKVQRRFISREVAMQLEQRFKIIRLDGDSSIDKTDAVDPASLSDDEFMTRLRQSFTPLTEFLSQSDSVRNSILGVISRIKKARQLCEARCALLDTPEKCVKTAFINTLSILGVSLQPALNLSIQDITDAVYTLDDVIKKGQSLNASISLLEQQNQNSLRACGGFSFRCKLISFEDLHRAVKSCINSRKRKALSEEALVCETVDIWSRLDETTGSHQLNEFNHEHIDTIIRKASSSRDYMERLYKFYINRQNPPIVFENYSHALEQCIRFHTEKVTTYIDIFEKELFKPLWDRFIVERVV